MDVRKHLADQFSKSSSSGTINLNYSAPAFVSFDLKLERFRRIIEKFEELVGTSADIEESKVQKFLEENPILLSPYGQLCHIRYLNIHSEKVPLEESVIPDFIIKLPGHRYQVIEIERPGKRLARTDGVPAATLTQPVFQIAEFRDFVRNHYAEIKNEYPNISVNCTYLLIVGLDRNSDGSIKLNEQFEEVRRKNLLRQTFNVDTIYTYNDLLNNARDIYTRLSSLRG